MSFLYFDLGNLPTCSSPIGHIVVVICHFQPNHDSSERNPPTDGSVGVSSPGESPPTRTSPQIPAPSSESPLHAEPEGQQSQSEIPVQAPTLEPPGQIDASSEPHPPGRFRAKVTTPAAIEASKSRRKSHSKYFCKYCRQGFTRKSNLDQHYQSHLGVPNKLCPFCKQMFMGSISRHKKSCKQNPDRAGGGHRPEPEPEPPTQMNMG